MPKFPNRQSDDKAVENAAQVLRARYLEEVNSLAREILREAREEGYEDFDEAREWIHDRTHEMVDSSRLVIYTHEALNTLVQSPNWEAIEDVGIESAGEGMVRLVTVAAYYALHQDVAEEIEDIQDEYFEEED